MKKFGLLTALAFILTAFPAQAGYWTIGIARVGPIHASYVVTPTVAPAVVVAPSYQPMFYAAPAATYAPAVSYSYYQAPVFGPRVVVPVAPAPSDPAAIQGQLDSFQTILNHEARLKAIESKAVVAPK